MGVTFTKLFSGLTESTVWVEPYPTRVLWVSMLSWADQWGRVHGSVPGIARRAGINLDECEAALASFMAPDRFSRTPDHDGRRIEKIDGGWRLLNYAKYRELRHAEDRREQNREAQARHRAKLKQLGDSSAGNVSNSDDSKPNKPASAQADAEVEAEANLLETPPQEVRGEAARKRARPIPEGFGISSEIREWAKDNGFDQNLDAHLAYFVDFAKSKRKTYMDWDAAFRNCIRADWGDVRKSEQQRNKGNPISKADARSNWVAELTGRGNGSRTIDGTSERLD